MSSFHIIERMGQKPEPKTTRIFRPIRQVTTVVGREATLFGLQLHLISFNILCVYLVQQLLFFLFSRFVHYLMILYYIGP